MKVIKLNESKQPIIESREDTAEFILQIEELILQATPGITDKAFGKSYSFELDGETSADEAMDNFRVAVHDLAVSIY